VLEYNLYKEVRILAVQQIDGKKLKNMIISGANNLDNNKDLVNALNVFPVPDGDTGTNMSLTMSSAVKEVKNTKKDDVFSIIDAIANGSLMGARGNSGVILSQIFRGFAKGLKSVENINCTALAHAFMEGSNTAYKAVMKPTEGTILTVIRESAEYAVKAAVGCASIELLLEKIIEKANKTLERTPDMLPVLKQAGVVDAGGKGLIYIFEGMYSYLVTEKIIEISGKLDISESETEKISFQINEQEIVFGYCTEFFLKASGVDVNVFRNQLAELGDSIVVVGDDNIVKVHIHTNNPGKILEKALERGELSKIKIENMREQHRQMIAFDKEDIEASSEIKKYGFVAVAMGQGISSIFQDLGTDVVIEGGQTMNPSTEDILKSINTINAENIIIFPNNSNIVLAANQAKSLSDKNVIVALTKTIPQGISALMAVDIDKLPEDNIKKIERAISDVKTGLITYAVRSSNFDGKDIEEGDILGIIDGTISEVGQEILEVSEKIIDGMINESSSLVSIYYGNDIKEKEAKTLVDYIQKKHSDCEIEMHYGGQPLYYYIISAE